MLARAELQLRASYIFNRPWYCDYWRLALRGRIRRQTDRQTHSHTHTGGIPHVSRLHVPSIPRPLSRRGGRPPTVAPQNTPAGIHGVCKGEGHTSILCSYSLGREERESDARGADVELRSSWSSVCRHIGCMISRCASFVVRTLLLRRQGGLGPVSGQNSPASQVRPMQAGSISVFCIPRGPGRAGAGEWAAGCRPPESRVGAGQGRLYLSRVSSRSRSV